MARSATKKVANKTPQKNKRLSTKALSAIDKVEQSFKSAQAEVERHQNNLRIARGKLKARRVEAAKKGTRASQALVDRAYAAVAKAVVSVDEAHRKASLVKAKVKVAKILQQVESAEVSAEERILALEVRLAGQAEEHLKSTLEKFETRWRKRRALMDARKLKLAKRSASSKVKSAAKKAQMEIKTVEKKAAKSLAKPVKTPGRPGRPKREAAVQTKVAKAAPKKRGRPATAKPASAVSATPKKRSRPAKSAAAKGVATKAPVSAVKKRGRPAKAKSVSVAAAPKRRGRPPKAK
ncbi:MAG: hypothetical protein KUG71_04210 [Porticoccaceae bacterium]|nr:hypothetical protein [Porticoccaceae bacterium]